MKTTYNLNTELGRKAAIAEYLKTKPREKYYEVQYLRYIPADDGYDVDGFEPSYLKIFTPEQLELVKCAMEKVNEGEAYLWEAIEEMGPKKFEFLQTPPMDSYSTLDPKMVNLDTYHHMYKFKMAVFYDGIDAQPKIHEFLVVLTEEDYTTLVGWMMCHRGCGFNILYIYHSELYQKLLHTFNNQFSGEMYPAISAPTYAVEMTEIEEDAKMIVEKYGNK